MTRIRLTHIGLKIATVLLFMVINCGKAQPLGIPAAGTGPAGPAAEALPSARRTPFGSTTCCSTVPRLCSESLLECAEMVL